MYSFEAEVEVKIERDVVDDPLSDYESTTCHFTTENKESTQLYELPIAKSEDLRQLYEDHEFKEDMVVGPIELVQQTSKALDVHNATEEYTQKTISPKGLCQCQTECSCNEPIQIEIETYDDSNDLYIVQELFECVVCKLQFINKNDMDVHIQTHTQQKNNDHHVEVKNLNKSTSINKHTDKKLYTCEVCKKNFYRIQHLDDHMRVHKMYKVYKCEECKKEFTEFSKLKRHKDRVHTTLKKRYICDICKKVFRQKSYLSVHMRVHMDIKPHECRICQKKFNQSYGLTDHMTIHTGEKPFECEICKKKFSRKPYLRVHKRVHVADNRYECQLCNKIFRDCNKLKIHIRSHTGEKPYPCGLCDKRFSALSSLRNHQRVHNKKPKISKKTTLNQCRICNQKFEQSRQLDAHMLLHTH